MPSQPTLKELVERFHLHRQDYISGRYNETQVRREFIDPFFELLGWDVNNRLDHAEAYKDVIHEDSIKVGGATKAPDYCFRVGGTRKFFLEAKKPSVFIKEALGPAYQLRRYGWSAKLPLSILTDFEEFAVYDCRIKPLPKDKVSKARIQYFTYEDYQDKWDDLYATYSKEAVLKGSFDKFVATSKVKKGTAQVDDAFLSEIDGWREILAKNLKLRNPRLKSRELNFSVQRIIDRIIFLRMCEDRGIEFYGRLQALKNGSSAYGRLCQLFREADDRYNSGLFHFKEEKGRATPADDLTLELKVDDKVLKEIIKNLYYPESPYEFSVLPAEILGQVYEQFLGKVIRVTKGGQAKVEEKPEVKKAGGVYYTPAYIVDYIVQKTVGDLLKGKKPGKAVDEIKVLDPACGSGSFLIGAFQCLLDWYRDYYRDNGNQKQKKLVFQAQGGEWRLVTKEKKRILLTHIFGVDIDPQAVEVTKLSLLLKVLEGESDETLKNQLSLFKERALPDLGDNIKCGNSLIGSDFYTGEQTSLLDEEEQYRINAFDWEFEFPEIMSTGGFSAVIGNPPYVRQEGLGDFKEYFQSHFKVYHGSADLFAYFIERGVGVLKEEGLFSFIVANKWMRSKYGKPLRKWLQKFCISGIVDFGDLPVFKNVTTYPCILILKKIFEPKIFNVAIIKSLNFQSLLNEVESSQFLVESTQLESTGWSLQEKQFGRLLKKIKTKGIPLGMSMENKIFYGIKTGRNDAFVLDCNEKEDLIAKDLRSKELLMPFLRGKDIKRYKPLKNQKYLIFSRRGTNINEFTAVKNYLGKLRNRLEPKPANWKPSYEGEKWSGRKTGNYKWYEIQDTVEYFKEFEKPKIIFPSIVKHPIFVLDNNHYYSNDKTSIISNGNNFLLGILNSKVTDFLMRNFSSTKQGGYFEYKPMYVEQIPIPIVNKNNENKMLHREKIEKLVELLLELNVNIDSAKTPEEKSFLQKKIDTTDREIDQLVYQLYDLTPEEIALVEEAVQ